MTDEQVRAAAATGGVVGINGLGEFLPDTDAGSEAMFRHLDHLVALVGPRHAGLGLDFLDDPPRFWAIVRAEAFRWPPLPFGRKRDALVWDNTLPWGPDYADAEMPPRFHRAGIDLISLSVMGPEAMLDGTIRQIARVRAAIAREPDRYALCGTAGDILAAKASGKLALVFNLQETNMLEGRLEMVQACYDLGVRHMLLAYNARNHVGDGCGGRTDGGLSRWGWRWSPP